MDAEYEAIVKALGDYQPSEKDSWFVDTFVVGSVTETNVHEVMKLMSQSAGLNRYFWSLINGAPSSEEEWLSIFWIGSDMSEEQQNRTRQRLRGTVEIVRAAIGGQQVRRNSLFRGRM